jgi:hypothetical protein
MPFDPNIPQENTLIDAVQMREQLNALNDDIQNRTTQADLNNAIASTSNNSNNVGTLGQGADGNYNQSQMQDLINKVDELINALRR